MLSFQHKMRDPLCFCRALWPHVRFYNKQIEVIYSVRDNFETFVPAGNMLGKDFVAAFIVIWFFMTRYPCRILTTSVDSAQLEGVLWGEMKRFLQTSKIPLDSQEGGPLIINHQHIKRIVKGKVCGISEIIGRVAAKGEGMLGRHVADIGDGIPRTLYVADEASSIDDTSYEAADTWARRKLVLGNPYPCNNFFYRAVKEGDILAPS